MTQSNPEYAQKKAILDQGKSVLLAQWLSADVDTPVSAFLKLKKVGACTLFESVEGGEKWGRFSVIGLKPRQTLRIDRSGNLLLNDQVLARSPQQSLEMLKQKLAPCDIDCSGHEHLPKFIGGWVGYFGYGMVHHFEPKVPDQKQETLPFAEALWCEIDLAVVFDNIRHMIAVLKVVHPEPTKTSEAALAAGNVEVARVVEALGQPLPTDANQLMAQKDRQCANIKLTPIEPKESFLNSVEQARSAILAGDCIQVVMSQRFIGQAKVDSFSLYRALRLVNPSPYLFYLEMPEGCLVGSSPEVMVRKEGQRAMLRPIAGTRPRGQTVAEDTKLAQDLLADAKEVAEHVMLVDLGRNDLGRVCLPGSVHVTQQMIIERYSHVMHIVSNIEGTLLPDQDAFSLLKATFPAGTVSGAPKIKAMQLIEEFEQLRRGPYAGTVGYFNYNGDLDACITIRTFFLWDDYIVVHAGAGIVADSQPEQEYEETLNKAKALFKALDMVCGEVVTL